MIDTLRQDLSYALRRLRQAPGFSLVAVATLALGIGATTAIFSVVNAVLLRPAAVPGTRPAGEDRADVEGPPRRLLAAELPRRRGPVDRLLRPRRRRRRRRHPDRPGRATRLEGAGVSASFFDVLRVRPLHGRGFVAGENEPGRNKVAVLGYPLWRDRFGADPGVVGRTVSLNRQPHVVVGIAPPGFRYPEDAEIWTPMEYDQRFRTNSRGAWYLTVVGRLRDGSDRGRRAGGGEHDRRAPGAGVRRRQRGRRRHRDPASRRHGGRVAPGPARAPGRGRPRAARGVRERREPAPRPHRRARDRARGAGGARRRAAAGSSASSSPRACSSPCCGGAGRTPASRS